MRYCPPIRGALITFTRVNRVVLVDTGQHRFLTLRPSSCARHQRLTRPVTAALGRIVESTLGSHSSAVAPRSAQKLGGPVPSWCKIVGRPSTGPDLSASHNLMHTCRATSLSLFACLAKRHNSFSTQSSGAAGRGPDSDDLTSSDSRAE